MLLMRAMRAWTWLLPLLVALALGTAEAQDAPRSFGRAEPLLPWRLETHLGLTWDGGFGLGARADIPLVKSFRYAPRDELALSIGTDIAFAWLDAPGKLEGYPTVALQWSLGVSDRFSFFPELGLGARISREGWQGFIPTVAFGARYYLQRSFGLVARLGWPVALTAGVAF